MSKIAIVKVRSAHDVEWRLPDIAAAALRALGMGQLKDHLQAAKGQAFMPQLTLPYLAALGYQYNEQNGMTHRFVFIDDREENIDLRGFDMVWFTTVTSTAQAVYRLSDRARRLGITTVIGGIHATMCQEESAAHADALALGEGETTVPELLTDWDAPGHRLRPRYFGAPTGSLDHLPLPRWRDTQAVDYCPWIVPVQTSRGCRNACSFCSTTRYQGARRRHRPVDEIVNEIRWLKDEGILTDDKVVFFTDNNIVSDSDHRRGVSDTQYARSLFQALTPLKIHWVGQGEINVAADPELTLMMARSGCIMMLVGFETMQQDNLRALGKPGNQVETYIRHIETLHRHAISVIGCFMFGLDNDSPDVFEKSFDFINNYIDIPQISLLTPFPGTVLYRQALKDKRLLHPDWTHYDTTHAVMTPKKMTIAQLRQGYNRLTQRLYTYPNIVRRAFRHAMRPTVHHHRSLPFTSRFSSVLAPNIIYRHLSLIGKGAEETMREFPSSDPLPLRDFLYMKPQKCCPKRG